MEEGSVVIHDPSQPKTSFYLFNRSGWQRVNNAMGLWHSGKTESLEILLLEAKGAPLTFNVLCDRDSTEPDESNPHYAYARARLTREVTDLLKQVNANSPPPSRNTEKAAARILLFSHGLVKVRGHESRVYVANEAMLLGKAGGVLEEYVYGDSDLECLPELFEGIWIPVSPGDWGKLLEAIKKLDSNVMVKQPLVDLWRIAEAEKLGIIAHVE